MIEFLQNSWFGILLVGGFVYFAVSQIRKRKAKKAAEANPSGSMKDRSGKEKQL